VAAVAGDTAFVAAVAGDKAFQAGIRSIAHAVAN
ncbi:hypothetical protein, partial [Escherichia coli]